MTVIHSLKITTLYFNAVVSSEKKAELRVNDRNFKCGDFLLLREWEDEFTGNKCLVKVTHILPLDDFSISGNWVMLSIAHIGDDDIQSILDARIGGVQ